MILCMPRWRYGMTDDGMASRDCINHCTAGLAVGMGIGHEILK